MLVLTDIWAILYVFYIIYRNRLLNIFHYFFPNNLLQYLKVQRTALDAVDNKRDGMYARIVFPCACICKGMGFCVGFLSLILEGKLGDMEYFTVSPAVCFYIIYGIFQPYLRFFRGLYLKRKGDALPYGNGRSLQRKAVCFYVSSI